MLKILIYIYIYISHNWLTNSKLKNKEFVYNIVDVKLTNHIAL